MRDRWADLWDLATDDLDGVAQIIPDMDDQDRVTLRWSDGSHSSAYWDWDCDSWEFEEELSTCPCDKDAR